MKRQYTVTKIKEINTTDLVLKQAYISEHLPKLMVILGSEEIIFGKTYMSAITQNKRIGKFLKNSLDFTKHGY